MLYNRFTVAGLDILYIIFDYFVLFLNLHRQLDYKSGRVTRLLGRGGGGGGGGGGCSEMVVEEEVMVEVVRWKCCWWWWRRRW